MPTQSSVTYVMINTDWELLSRQKLMLLQAMRIVDDAVTANPDLQTQEYLDGLLNWIDAVQDAADKDGHPVVWLQSEEEE